MMNKILCRTQTLIFAICFDFTRIGESTKPMTRAKISTHKGVAEQTFTPAHVTIFASDLSDLSESNIMNKVSIFKSGQMGSLIWLLKGTHNAVTIQKYFINP